MKRRIVSGIQPSGILHLGNYLGAVKQWIGFQNTPNTDCYFFIADYHSLTSVLVKSLDNPVLRSEDNIESNNLLTLASLLASGLNPEKVCIFNQSHIPEHLELFWILNCMTPLNKLNNMIQYKEKKANLGTHSGLLTYPVLMASDILLYKANEVPVGEDQMQHLELTRDLAARLNKVCRKEILPVPNCILSKGGRIMSLQNGKSKMSKSDEKANSNISLLDKQEDIKNKIYKAKTDTISEIYFDKNERPEVSNLINIYAELNDISVKDVEKKFEKANMYEFKTAIIEEMNAKFLPICEKTRTLMKDNDFLYDVLKNGKKKAKIEAEKTIFEIKSQINLLI